MSKLTVRARLLLAFGILAALVLMVSAIAGASLSASQSRFANYLERDAKRAQLAKDMLDGANARAVAARNLVLMTSDSDRKAASEAVRRAHGAVNAALAALAGGPADAVGADERGLLEAVRSVEARYGPVALEIVRLAEAGERDAAVAKMNAECNPLLSSLLDRTAAYIAHLDDAARARVVEGQHAYDTSSRLLAAAALIAVGLAIGLGIYITRGLVQALGAEPARLGAIASRVAAGDLSEEGLERGAAAGSVLASLAEMQARLAGVLGQVRSASDSIATASAEIASGTADLSQRTEEQASNLQQTAASMQQMNTGVANNAESSRQASELAAAASAAARQGGEVVGRVVDTMGAITGSSRRIGEIIGVIDGIAFQTNILALNAAVEAARAGEQGRGFAVVASEVRTLAQRSAEAAKEIKTLISHSVEQVESGAKLVETAGAAMTDIVTRVQGVADMVGEITSATVEQREAASQVHNAITQLDDVTQQNAALVEESAAATESLRGQATTLASVVLAFKLPRAVAGSRGLAVETPASAHRAAPRAAEPTLRKPAARAPAAAPVLRAVTAARTASRPAVLALSAGAASTEWESF
ncbi:methyl-accepting chemotaxis protein [Rhizobacter sp. LjRoot28]|uniref:methyl-accepting chemotaxis protein n=1 Tax=Rhizobacter sp. LjRoot28 TaxID=3342309 RepID=UPI003ED00FAE